MSGLNAVLTDAGWEVDNILGLSRHDAEHDAIGVSRHRLKIPYRGSILPVVSKYEGIIPTYTRATGSATTHGNLGYLHYCRAGEIRFGGFRRVENLISDSEGFSTGWTAGGSSVFTASSPADGGGTLVYSGTTAAASILTLNSAAYVPGKHVFSVDMSAATQPLVLTLERSSDSAVVATMTINATGGVKRYSLAGVITDTTNHRLVIRTTLAANASVELHCAQLERKSDPNDSAPSEYIPRGVSGHAAPFYGAGVDGVRYFDYLNPWVVASNIATCTGTPTPIDEDLLLGIAHDHTAVQSFLRSSTLDNASWTASALTPTQDTAQDNPLGYGFFYKLTENTADAEHKLSQDWSGTIPTAAGTLMLGVSGFVKAGTKSWIRLGFTGVDGATNQVWFNAATGEVGTISGSLTSAEVIVWETGVNGVYRVGFVANGGSTGTARPNGWIALADEDGSSSYTGASEYVWAGGMQFEAGDYVSTYIGNSAGSALTRALEVHTIPNTALPASKNDFTIGFHYTPMYNTGTKKKRAFHHIVYSKTAAYARWGLTLRPGTQGGGSDTLAGDFAQDFYPNNSDRFGGVFVRNSIEPFDTVPIYFGQSSEPQQTNGDGSFCMVDGVESTITSTSTPTLQPILYQTAAIEVGGNGAGTANEGYGGFWIKDFCLFDVVIGEQEQRFSAALTSR